MGAFFLGASSISTGWAAPIVIVIWKATDGDNGCQDPQPYVMLVADSVAVIRSRGHTSSMKQKQGNA